MHIPDFDHPGIRTHFSLTTCCLILSKRRSFKQLRKAIKDLKKKKKTNAISPLAYE